MGPFSSQRLVAKTNLPCSSPSYGKKTPFNFKKLTFKHQQCEVSIRCYSTSTISQKVVSSVLCQFLNKVHSERSSCCRIGTKKVRSPTFPANSTCTTNASPALISEQFDTKLHRIKAYGSMQRSAGRCRSQVLRAASWHLCVQLPLRLSPLVCLRAAPSRGRRSSPKRPDSWRRW